MLWARSTAHQPTGSAMAYSNAHADSLEKQIYAGKLVADGMDKVQQFVADQMREMEVARSRRCVQCVASCQNACRPYLMRSWLA